MSAVAVSPTESSPPGDTPDALPSTGTIDIATDAAAGLTAGEVADRRANGLGNQVDDTSSRSYQQIVRENLFTFLNVSLFGIGVVLVALGLFRDAIMSSGFAFVNASIAIVQKLIAKRRLAIAFIMLGLLLLSSVIWEFPFRETVIAMIPLFATILNAEWLRRFFDISLLGGGAYAVIAAVAIGWLILLRCVYATHVHERLFGLEIEPV